MSKRNELRQRQAEALKAKQGTLTEPTQEFWDGLVLDPRFDELYRYLASRADEQAVPSSDVHIYAHNQGVKDGWLRCLDCIFQGYPEKPVATRNTTAIYNSFSTDPKNFA